jgi:hypothetical protein
MEKAADVIQAYIDKEELRAALKELGLSELEIAPHLTAIDEARKRLGLTDAEVETRLKGLLRPSEYLK